GRLTASPRSVPRHARPGSRACRASRRAPGRSCTCRRDDRTRRARRRRACRRRMRRPFPRRDTRLLPCHAVPDVSLAERLLALLASDASRLASARWPGVQIADADFAAYVVARLPPGPTGSGAIDLEAAIAAIDLRDLYLACGVGRGDPVAL